MMRGIAKLVLALNLTAIAVLAFAFPHLMVSPGGLTDGHRASETDCFACHDIFLGASSEKCGTCHKVADIGVLTTKGIPVVDKKTKVPFHQKLVEQDCVACHSDHAGMAVYRIRQRFSHGLVDAPTREQCVACHQRPTDALHRQVSDNCAQCHVVEKWKPAKFKHDMLAAADREQCVSCHKAKVPADMLHRQVSDRCGQCHGTDKWKPARFEHALLTVAEREKCFSCHRDKLPVDRLHRQVSDRCGQCHGTDKWKPATFDHRKYFVFDRDHDVKCSVCHPTDDYKQYTCYGCHEHTPGKIREEHREEGIRDYENCVACHRSADEEEAERAWESIKRGIPYKFEAPSETDDERRRRKDREDDDDDDD